MRQGHYVALVLVAMVVCSGCSAEQHSDHPLRDRVMRASMASRPYVAPISNEQGWSACHANGHNEGLASLRCNAQLTPTSPSFDASSATRSLAELSADIAQAVEREQSVDAMWAAALLELWSGAASPKAIDRAIDRLTAVNARGINSPLAAHHLSIAHLARAAVRDDPVSLYAALEWSERAYLADTTDLAIGLTRAVLLSNLGADLTARDGLLAVQAQQVERGWGDEIDDRLDVLTRRGSNRPWSFIHDAPLQQRNLQRAREWVFDSLLPAWLQIDAVGRIGLAERATELGERIEQTMGDSSVVHVARGLRALDQPAGAEGLRALLSGFASYRTNQIEKASLELQRSVSLLQSSDAVALAAWGRVMLGATLLAVPNFAAAENELRQAIAVADTTGSIALRGRALWALGLVQARQNSLIDSRESFARSRDAFRQIGEYANAADVSASLAQILSSLGVQSASARTGYDALTLGSVSGATPRPAQHIAVAEQLRQSGLGYAARALNMAAVRHASKTNLPFPEAEALSWLAKTQAQLGRTDEAKGSIQRARELLLQVADRRANERLSADLDRAEASLEAAINPRGAIAAHDRARRYFDQIAIEKAPMLLERGELLLAVGDSAAGLIALEAAMAIADSMVGTADLQSRRSLVSTQRDVRRQLAAVALARADTAGALRHSIAAAGGYSSLRPGTSMSPFLHVVALDRQVMSWLLMGDSVRLEVTSTSRDSLGTLAHRFADLVRTGVDPVAERQVGALLYTTLLGAHAERLRSVLQLDVSVDELLADLPISALPVDDTTLVVDRLAVRMRATANVRDVVAVAAKTVRRGPLVIRNPEWRSEQHPDLERLRFADEEGDAVRSAYVDGFVLTGATATLAAVRDGMHNFDVVHFAGHARVNTEVSGASHLVLSAVDETDDGLLFASDLSQMDLRHVRVAVLSSCGRPALSARSRDAANGLTLALLDAGVRSVVSGLWEVDDEVAALLMVEFHAALRAGFAPHEALQRSEGRCSQGREGRAGQCLLSLRTNVRCGEGSHSFGA